MGASLGTKYFERGTNSPSLLRAVGPAAFFFLGPGSARASGGTSSPNCFLNWALVSGRLEGWSDPAWSALSSPSTFELGPRAPNANPNPSPLLGVGFGSGGSVILVLAGEIDFGSSSGSLGWESFCFLCACCGSSAPAEVLRVDELEFLLFIKGLSGSCGLLSGSESRLFLGG